ncbi:MAG: methyltransferase domain-containing protein [Gammaproteobacteria bacterium]
MASLFDQAALRRQRNLSAEPYSARTDLPLIVERELAERLDVLTLDSESLLVLGAVHADILKQLCERFVRADVSIVDISGDRLDLLEKQACKKYADRVRFVRSPGWSVPVEQPPADLVFSNLYLPLCDDLGTLFSQLHRVMTPDGCLHFSSLGPDSFLELRNAWKQVDPGNVFHTLEPPDMHDVGDALMHAGFREPVMDRDNYTLTYSSVKALMTDLRNHGVCNGFAERSRGLTGQEIWAKFVGELSADQRDGRFSLTLEVVTGQAWRGDGMPQQRRADGGIGISLDELASGLRRGR